MVKVSRETPPDASAALTRLRWYSVYDLMERECNSTVKVVATASYATGRRDVKYAIATARMAGKTASQRILHALPAGLLNLSR